MAWAHRRVDPAVAVDAPSTSPELALRSLDGELFSVSKEVWSRILSLPKEPLAAGTCLSSSILLSHAGEPPAELDVDCLSLDWVLRFLEAEVASSGSSEAPQLELDVGEIESFLAVSRR